MGGQRSLYLGLIDISGQAENACSAATNVIERVEFYTSKSRRRSMGRRRSFHAQAREMFVLFDSTTERP